MFVKNIEKEHIINKLEEEDFLGKHRRLPLLNSFRKSREFVSYEFKDVDPDNVLINEKRNKEWIEILYFTYSKLEKWSLKLSEELKTEIVIINYLHDSGYSYFSYYNQGQKLKELEMRGLPDGPHAEFYDGDYSEIGVKTNYGKKSLDYEEDLDRLLLNHMGFGSQVLDDYCNLVEIKLFDYNNPNRRNEFQEPIYLPITTDKADLRKEQDKRKWEKWESKIKNDNLPF